MQRLTMVPRSLYLERMGRRSAALRLRSSGGSASSVSRKVAPSHHGATSPTAFLTLAAVYAEMGMKTTSFFVL